jgi:branched-chain amino acid transport system permease protein
MLFVSALISGIVLGGLYALIGAGLNLIFGVVKVINFAKGSLLMLAIYIVYWIVTPTGIDPYMTLPAVVFLMAALGYYIQRGLIGPVLGKERISQLLITFGLALFIENVMVVIMGPNVRSVNSFLRGEVVTIGPARVSADNMVMLAVTALTIALLFAYLRFTKMGTAIRAVSQQPDSAELAGINVKQVYGVAFAIGTALTGVAGVLMSTSYDIFPIMGQPFGLMAFIVVVLGGVGNVQGAAIAGLFLGIVQNLFGTFVDFGLSLAFIFLFFIVALMVRPNGLFGKAVRVA